MVNWWDVVPDHERQQWSMDPFVAVGPLCFGMTPDEVSMALSGTSMERQQHTLHQPDLDAASMVVKGRYSDFGLCLHYREERLAAVVVDAQRGPQVLVDETPLVGRVPSTIEQWMIHRAEAHEPHDELVYMDAGVPGSESLGIVIDVQRVGDRPLTRPVFVPPEAMDDLSHWLPRDAWSRC
ncbi:hypothetical protein [Streptomyces sp. SR-10]|uniref:hypothetical protein n=1 Tax=Streptomyces sp. SR-10 TaxID=3416442 RepID=UPI003CE8ACF0